jgi:hypothetical protein
VAHPLLLALFTSPAAAAGAARDIRALGLPPDRVSIVARSHDEEGQLARAADVSPGSEIEDSRLAARFGELAAHLLAAIALVMPGIGPIVANGPLAAGLGEAAGHVAGGIRRRLEAAGVPTSTAADIESRIEAGAILVGVHADPSTVAQVRAILARTAASGVVEAAWEEA